MKRDSIWPKIWLATLLCGAWGPAADATPRSYSLFGYEPAFEISERLELGARVCHFYLKDARRNGPDGPSNSNPGNNFLGSLWGLDETQDYLPRLYAQYAFIPYFGIGATYDQLVAQTRDTPVEEKNWTTGDGDLHLWGPMFYLFARYPNATRFTPLAELGWAYYFTHFSESYEWASGGPYWRFETEDTSGYFLGLGVDVALTDQWHVNAYFRSTFGVEVDARALFSKGPRPNARAGSFPMEYDMLGLGISYCF